MEYNLRPAIPADLDIVLRWIENPDQLRFWGGPSLSFPPEGDSIWAAIKGDDHNPFSMIDHMDQIVGFGQFFPTEPGCVHLARIIISPERRGQGLGRMLCQQLMEQATKQYHPGFLSLRVYAENTPAVVLYQSLGFSECASQTSTGEVLMKAVAQPSNPFLIFEDDLFRIEHCESCPLPGYLILHVKGGNSSIDNLDGCTSPRLGTMLSATTNAIITVIHPERIYCLSFGEVNPELHFHLFPRTRWLLEKYWEATGTEDEPIDGPRLFQWARTSLGHEIELPEKFPKIADVCRQIRGELNPSLKQTTSPLSNRPLALD